MIQAEVSIGPHGLAGELVVPPNMRLMLLPPYSPSSTPPSTCGKRSARTASPIMSLPASTRSRTHSPQASLHSKLIRREPSQ